MEIEKLLVIPVWSDISKMISLSEEYGVGFEYNDFFVPSLLNDNNALEERISFYQKNAGSLPLKTLHGCFFDITIASEDPEIVKISDMRMRSSMEIAKRLNASAVIFHTNYIANFVAQFYMDNWVKRNAKYYRELCAKYSDINILVENMFDDEPDLICRLAQELWDVPNFGVCFDYAHAHVFGNEKSIDEWVDRLSPHIKHVHINDNDFISDLHLPVGDGKIDWNKFKEHFKKFSDASVLVEVTGYDKTKKSLEFLKSL